MISNKYKFHVFHTAISFTTLFGFTNSMLHNIILINGS